MNFAPERSRTTGRVPRPVVLPQLPHLNAGAAMLRTRTGGDFYDFVRISDSDFLLCMLDVSGPRGESQEIAAAAQEMLHAQSHQCFEAAGNLNVGLSQITLELNKTILSAAGGVRNTPAFLGAFSADANTLSFINAGHTPALLCDEDGIAEYGAGGVPLGLFSHVVHEPRMVVIRPGAWLLLVSKGLIEARSGHNEFGMEGVRQVVQNYHYGTAEELCRRVLQAAQKFEAVSSFWGPRLVFSGFADREPSDMSAVALMRPAEARMFRAAAS
jgi:serine phosphatase RsbU (regulator of sigma subunit)